MQEEATIRFSLSWSAGGGEDPRGGNRKDPEWSHIETRLKQIIAHSGSVTLNILEGPEIGPVELQVFSDGGRYLLMLGEVTGEDYEVRTLYDNTRVARMINILGDLWDIRTVCTDPKIVERAFREFFETGDVSQDLLS